MARISFGDEDAGQLSPIAVLEKRRQELLDEGNPDAANALSERIAQLESEQSSSIEPPVTAEPMSQEAEKRFDGVTIREPAPKPTAPTAALQTKEQIASVPPESQVNLTPEPVEPQPDSRKLDTPVDETEQMFQDYNTRRSTAEQELSDFEAGQDARESQRGVMTGVAGALSAFGEGLAAITGGSAKPLQAGVAAVKSIGEQQAEGESRKAKSLRERILQSRQPLEQKADEIKFRDVFEERQAKKDLADPASVKSQQARELANSFLDTYIASVSNRTSEQDLAKLEGVRPKLENMSAAQIKDFMDNLNKLKFTESREDIEKIKSEGRVQVEGTKREQKLMDVADKEFSTDAKKLNEAVTGLKDYQNKVDRFRKDIDLALGKGDAENKDPKTKAAMQDAAIKRIVQMQGVISYLIARQSEPKGVFTDTDYAALNSLGSGLTWAGQFQNWMSKGLGAANSTQSLETMKNVIDTLGFTKKDPNDLVKGYQRVYKLSNNPYKQQYAEKFGEATGGDSSAQSAPPAQRVEFPDVESAKAARRAGQIKVGDVFYIKGDPKSKKVK